MRLLLIALLCSSAAGAEDQLHVYNWSDYIAPETLERFETRTGVKVVYDVFDNADVMTAKVLTGGSGYDLIFPPARPNAEKLIASGALQPFDPAQLAGLDSLEPSLRSTLGSIDPDGRFALPYMWGTTGIGYNVEKVRAALGTEVAVDDWSVIFNPENAAKLASCGIAILDDENEAFAAAMFYLGQPPMRSTADDIAKVQQTYAAIRPHVRYFHSSQYINDLANGAICIALGYSGDVLQARDRAAEAENGVEIAYAIPRQGAIRWIDMMAIPKDAPRPDLAHRFVSFLLEPEVIAEISNYVSYANPNIAATDLVDDEIRSDPGIYPPATVAAKLVDLGTVSASERRARSRAWTRIKAGN